MRGQAQQAERSTWGNGRLGSEALLFMASGFYNSQGVDSSSQDESPYGVASMAAG